MPTEHFIAGKDASLEASIAAMQARLQSHGFHVVERSWLNPVEGVWSVHISERDCPLLFSNGKGGSEQAARASALGEFFERLSTNYFWTHYYLGEQIANHDYTHYPQERWFPLESDEVWPSELLTPELHDYYNPEGSVTAARLVDLNSGNAARGICAIPYVRLRDGVTAWFPVNLIGNLYASNGMAAGNTLPEARAQALSEIFERHIKFRIIAEGLCLPDVPDEVIARYPHIAAGIAGLRAAGFAILVKDASLGGQYPVMNVTLLNPHDQGIFSSFGAHPRLEIALERALTELLQGRALDALGGFPEPGFDMEEIAHAQNLELHFVDSSGVIGWNFLGSEADFEFVDWNFSTTTAEDYQWLVDKIHAMGHDIYVADFTHLGVYACRIIVPGMSDIYPVDDLEWDNNSVGNLLRPPLLRLTELNSEECEAVLEVIEALALDDHAPVAPLIGLAADPGSLWRELRIGELKTLLALAAGNEEMILEGCHWLRHFNQLSDARQRVYRCIESLLNLGDSEPYRTALAKLYGVTALQQAEALLNNEERFFGLVALGSNLEHCATHQRLLAAYRKIWQ
ncbi:MAG TPA: 30S ribosomal protein S12 methylthiotransferase accessory factor YcaO [Gammaproteobacteria bacterium]